MKESYARKWIEDLRSGEYVQDPGGGHLKTISGYCCLGVLAEQSDVPWDNLHGTSSLSKEGLSVALGTEVREELGMCSAEGGVAEGSITINHQHYVNLADANDQGVSFSSIADWLETDDNWKKL